jgi:hypothetical protein
MKIARTTTRRPSPSSHGTRRRRGVSLATESLFRAGGESTPAMQSAQQSERDRRLEEVLLTTWAALKAGHPVECPVCSGPLTVSQGCRNCGSKLS